MEVALWGRDRRARTRRLGVGIASVSVQPTAPGVDPTTVVDAEAFEALIREVCARVSASESNAMRLDGCLGARVQRRVGHGWPRH